MRANSRPQDTAGTARRIPNPPPPLPHPDIATDCAGATSPLWEIPSARITIDISAMAPEDVPSAHALLTEYLRQFKLAPQLSEEEFAHWLLPREGVVDCFVVKDEDGKVCALMFRVKCFVGLGLRCVGVGLGRVGGGVRCVAV